MILDPPLVIENVVVVDSSTVVLVGIDSRELRLALEGDCCSSSYFTPEALADLRSLFAHALREWEEVASNRPDGSTDEAELTQWYALKLTTNTASFSLDWRSDSNGYYSGWLTVTGP